MTGDPQKRTGRRQHGRASVLLIAVATAVAVLPGVPAAAAPPVAVDDAYTIPEEGTSAGNYQYERQWGNYKSYGIAVDGAGTVYVIGVFDSLVHVYSPDGVLLDQWGGNTTATPAPEGKFWQPHAIAVDSSGVGGAATAVYVADQYYNRIQKFAPDGTFERLWGWGVDSGAAALEVCLSGCQGGIGGSGEGQLRQPYGIAVNDDGTLVYVVDAWNERVQKFGSDGSYIDTWGSHGTGDGQFTTNWGIEVHPNGNVYVADTHGDRIQSFTPDGTYLGQFGSIGTGAGELWRPKDIAFGSTGDIFVADQANNRIQQFTAAGAPIGQWGGEATGNGQLDSPNGVDVGPGDFLYVADTWNDRVQKFAPAPTGVLNNDSDGDGDPLTAVLDTDVSNGTLTLDPGGTFVYTPDLNWNGVDSFTYHANDGGADSNIATVTITVAPFNDAPVAVDDVYNVSAGGQLRISAPGIVANDTDVEGDAFIDTFQVGDVAHGTLDFEDDGVGSFTYVPDAGFQGTDSFSYYVRDAGFRDSEDATVTITVEPVSIVMLDDFEDGDTAGWTAGGADNGTIAAVPAPAPVRGAYSGKVAFSTSPTASCYGPRLPFSSMTPEYFSLYFRADGDTGHPSGIAVGLRSTSSDWLTLLSLHSGSLRYSSPSDYFDIMPAATGTWYFVELRNVDWVADTFDIWVDGIEKVTGAAFHTAGLADLERIQAYACPTTTGPLYVDEIRYGGGNAPPVANDDQNYQTPEDVQLVVSAPGVLDNDSDPDGDPITAVLETDVSHGILNLAADGSFSYDPDPHWSGTDTFTYRANDGALDSNVATATITVTPVDEIFYVDQSAPLGGNGLTWASAFVDLQDALAVAFSGDSIQVAEGTYLPSTTGDTAAAFQTVHEVDMKGGYPAGGGAEANPNVYPTILSGDLGGDDGSGVTSDNSVTVVDISSTHLRFEFFTVTGAVGQGVGGSNTAVLFATNLIDGNHGRGVHLTGTAGVFFAGTTVSNNSAGAGAGGGIYLEGTAAARFADAIIERNSAASGAGAFVEGTVTMYNTVFRGNTGFGATTDGGGLKLAGAGDSVIMNTTFAGNEANVGSAIVVDGGSVSIVNSTLTGNTAAASGGTLIQLDDGSVSVDNSIMWDNLGSGSIASATATYSIVEGGFPGAGNLDADPLFKDADGPDDAYGTADDNVRLLGTSPAIDAGDNTKVPPDTLGLDNDPDSLEPTPHDLDHRDRFFDRGNPDTGVLGDPLVFDGVVDMGAFELGNEAPIAQPDSYTTNEDVPLVVVAPGVLFNDGDDDRDTISAQSAGGELHGTVSLAADGSFTFTPEPDYHTPPGGDAQFQYQAVDPTGASSDVETVTIYVNDVNDEPSFTMGPDVVQLEVGTGPDFRGGWATNISAGPPNESAQVLTFTLTPDDPSLFLVPPAISPATGNMTYTVVPDANGSTEVTVVLKDDGGVEDGGDDTSPSFTFTFTILPVNDEPFLANSVGGDDTHVLEGSGAHSFSGWATEIKAGPPNESAQSLAVTLVPADGSLFSVPPALDLVSGDLTFTLAPNATGSTLVTITLTDDGGTANGGDDTFVDTFTIAIGPGGPPGPPGADDWSFSMDESGVISGNVLGPGGPGGEGCTPTVALVAPASHGTLTLTTDGTFAYVHDGSSATTDFFTYKVLCGGLESEVAMVTFNISLLSYSVGLVDPASGQWRLRSSFTDAVTSFYFGDPGDVPFMGDWDCDGIDTPGLFRLSDAYAYLRNANSQGIADIRFFFGDPGDVPLPGDFNGDGCDTLSLYRPSTQTFFIMNALGENEGGLGAADFSFVFGNPGDKPVVGDWDGDGITEIGLHRESTGFFYWRNTLNTGIADDEIFFGDPGDRFVAGDFGVINGFDTPAVFRPGNATFYFRHSLTEGIADSQFVWGDGTWLPVAGVAG